MVNSRNPAPWTGRLTRPAHVWVNVTSDPARRSPGLLLMWRHVATKDRGWEGWVIYADFVSAHENLSVRQGWVSGAHIKPVGE